MLPTPQARCRVTIIGTLGLNRQGMTLPELYRVVAADLPGMCSRQNFADVVAELEAECIIDSSRRPGRGTRRAFFLAANGACVRIVPAAEVPPLPPMPKRTWMSALTLPAKGRADRSPEDAA